MTGVAIVGEIVDILVSGLADLGAGIGAGVSGFVQNLAFTTSGGTTTLSVFLVMICVFGAIALAVGLTTKIFNWLSSLGN